MRDKPPSFSVVRPGEERTTTRISQYSPEIMRMNAILRFMEGPATLARISRELIVLESLVEAAEVLGYKLPATRTMITYARALSPGIDGLGRGEAVKVLCSHPQNSALFPASPFDQEKKGGVLARFIAFLTGKKPEGGGI